MRYARFRTATHAVLHIHFSNSQVLQGGATLSRIEVSQ
jgi:hypothetical protein